MSEQSSHKQILRSSAIIGSSAVINVLVGLVRMKVAALLLGPVGIGLIGILQNLITTTAKVSSLGFGSVGTRQIAEANGRKSQQDVDAARRALFWGTLLLSLVGATVFWFVKELIARNVLDEPMLSGEVGWLSIGVALTVAAGSQQALLNGMRRIGDIARVSVWSSLLGTVVGSSALLWLGRDGLLLFVLASPAASFVISHIYVARLPKISTSKTPFFTLTKQWQTLVRLGFAFMIAGISGTIGQLIVRSLIQTNLGSESLGFFQAAWAISMVYISFVLTAMGTDYYPRLTAVIGDHKVANRFVNEQTEVAILLAGPILLGVLSFAPWIINLLYSEEFAPAVSILRWQILGDVLKIISWPMGIVLLASGKGFVFMCKEILVMLVFVIGVWSLLPIMNLESTGISYLLMYLVNVPILALLVYHLTKFRWTSVVLRDILVLLSFSVTISIAGNFNDVLGAIIGFLATFFFSLMALIRLTHKTQLTGFVGKFIERIKFITEKFGITYN